MYITKTSLKVKLQSENITPIYIVKLVLEKTYNTYTTLRGNNVLVCITLDEKRALKMRYHYFIVSNFARQAKPTKSTAVN